MGTPVQVLVAGAAFGARRLLRSLLAPPRYHVMEARSAVEIRALVATKLPDLVVLDVALPNVDDEALIRELRRGRDELPILVVSARARERDTVAALEAGADDFVVRPFGAAEFLARVRVALRRSSVSRKRAKATPLKAGDLVVDPDRRVVHVGAREVHLTPHEYELLRTFVRHEGKVLTHPQLLSAVWGPEHVDRISYLRVYVAQLRQKLEGDPSRPKYLRTLPGVGYLFDAGDAAADPWRAKASAR